MWQDQPLGLFWDARIYNTFALPVLGYVCQLEAPPAWVLEGIKTSLERAAKGPRWWASSEDLWSLRESFGLRASFHNLEWTAIAAQTRVVQKDPACIPRRRFQEAVTRIRSALANPAQLRTSCAWVDWYGRAFCLRLAESEAYVSRTWQPERASASPQIRSN